MKNISLFIATFLFISTVFAQRDGFDRSGDVNVDEQYSDLMEIESGGIFRGVDFDQSKQTVEALETARTTTSVYQDETDLLVITTDMGADIMNFADVHYKFDDKGLYHIKVETYSTDASAADKLYNRVKDYYTKKLGAGVLAQDDYLEFRGKNKANNYLVAIQNIGYEDSPGMYMYFTLDNGDVPRDGTDRYGNINVNDQYADLMEIESGGVFRGVNFDMSKQAVLDIETARKTTSVYQNEEEFELVITTDMGEDILNFADITYKFDEKGLYHIKVETYATDAGSNTKVYNMIKDYYANKLGPGVIAEDGYLEFYGKNRSYDYTVAMENLGYEDSPGLYLYIYVN